VPGKGFLVKVVYWLSGVCTDFPYLQLFNYNISSCW